MNTIYKVNSFFSSITNKRKLVNMILEESKKIVNAEASSLLLYDSTTDELYFDVVVGEKSEIVKQIYLKLGDVPESLAIV